jgi:O-antigen/teichoic acid export membrane protein
VFGNSHFDRIRQLFADQFEHDGREFLYRKNQKGPAIRVSEQERDTFVAAYNRRLKYAFWAIIPATIVLILLLAWLFPDVDSAAGIIAIWVGLVAILLPFVVVHRLAWHAPSRELQRRTPESDALTKEEARKLAFSKITYGQLIFVALFGVGLIWKMSGEAGLFHGWGAVWSLFGGGLISLACVQAVRKWHHDRYD